LLDQLFLFYVVDDEEALGHGPARRHAVDRHVVRPQLHRQAARVLVDGGLGDRVDHPVVAAEAAGDGADGDDAPGLAGHHLRRDLAAAEDGGQQVAVQHRLYVGQGNADGVIGAGPTAAADAGAAGADVPAGVGHEYVDPAPGGVD